MPSRVVGNKVTLMGPEGTFDRADEGKRLVDGVCLLLMDDCCVVSLVPGRRS